MILSIVILSYNTPDLVKKCVESIALHYKEEIDKKDIEIIVVDNASKKPPEDLEDVILVKNKKNYGFAKGCNIGAKKAKGNYVLFLNSDTKVLGGSLLEMIKLMETLPKVGVMGGKMFNPDNTPQPSCGKFYNLDNFLIMIAGGERLGLLRTSPDKVVPIDWVSGGCMMVNRKVFLDQGGFDEKFFMYMEDMELCYRFAKKGILTYFYPDFKVIHESHGSGSRKFAVSQIHKGLLYFYKKHKTNTEYEIVKNTLKLKSKAVYLIGRLT